MVSRQSNFHRVWMRSDHTLRKEFCLLLSILCNTTYPSWPSKTIESLVLRIFLCLTPKYLTTSPSEEEFSLYVPGEKKRKGFVYSERGVLKNVASSTMASSNLDTYYPIDYIMFKNILLPIKS